MSHPERRDRELQQWNPLATSTTIATNRVLSTRGMGQCVASRQGRALTLTVPQLERQGSVGMERKSRSRGQDDIRGEEEQEEQEEEEEEIYAGRDLVLAQTSRALQTIVSAERARRRRERAKERGKLSWVQRRDSWILGSQDVWIPGDREAWTAVCTEEKPNNSLIYPKRKMDRVPAYRYGSQEDEEEDEDFDEEEEGENPCDLDYQTAYRYCDRNNQFLVKEVVKKPGCETFEIDFGDGLVSKARKPSQLRRGGGRGGLIRRGGGSGGEVAGRRGSSSQRLNTSSSQPRGGGRGIQVRGIQRVSSFKRKHSFRKISSGSLVPAASKTKDDLPGSITATRRPGQLRPGVGRPALLAKPSILAKGLSKASVQLASPSLVAGGGSRASLVKANSPSVSLLTSGRGRGGRGRGLRGRPTHPSVESSPKSFTKLLIS